MTPHAQLLALIAEREASEAFSRATGWGVLVTHLDQPATVLGLYGPFCEPAAALEYAAEQEKELNVEYGHGLRTLDDQREGGFRCHVHPIMPVT